VVSQSVATAEATAAYRAATAARTEDFEAVLEADRALVRSKAARELREAGLQTGRRLVTEASVHVEGPLLRAYAEALKSEPQLGCYGAAFGVVGAALGAEPGDVASALLLSTANAYLQAAMRLGRISHRDAQGILHRVRPLALELSAEIAAGGDSRRLRAFHPLQEIASMRHERAEARLFAS
jgi:urease accessory protein